MGLPRARAALILAAVGGAVLLAVLGAACGGTDSDTTAQQAIDTLLREVVQPDALDPDARVVAYRLDTPLPAGTRIAAYLPDLLPEANERPPAFCATDEQVLDAPAWFFWIDDVAGAPTRPTTC